MNVLLWLFGAAVFASPCSVETPPDAAFEVQAPAGAARVGVLIELWVEPGQERWASSLLHVLDARGLPSTLVVPLPEKPLEPSLAALLMGATERGHEVAVRLTPQQVPDDLSQLRPLRRALRILKPAAGRVRAAVAPTRIGEPLLGRAGIRTLLAADGPATSTPRPARADEGQPQLGVVIRAGPYAGACGSSPRVAALTPTAGDRATQALHGAARTPGASMLRVALDGTDAEVEAKVLGRWLDEVILPAGLRPTTPSAARRAARASFRQPSQPSVAQVVGGRLVAVSEIRQAAEALRDVAVVPRSLPGSLTPTEAFLGFTYLLANRIEDQVVRLGPLDGPRTLASSSLGGRVEVPREEVVSLARSLAADQPREVPSSLRVTEHLFTASEILLLLAAAVRDEHPTSTRAVDVPDPHAPGLGWGGSSVP